MPSKKKKTAAPVGAIDVTSDAVVLAYVGDGRSARNTPARDLTHNDIARLAYQRSLAAVAADVGQPIDREDPESPVFERPDPRDPDQAIAATIVEELLGTGLYSSEVPEAAAPPATPPAPPAPPPSADSTDTPPAPPATPEG